jgi:hypothetical protein
MLSRKWIENLDASGRIYRKANEQYLPAYQAFWLLARDVSTGVLLFVFGWINAGLVLIAGFPARHFQSSVARRACLRRARRRRVSFRRLFARFSLLPILDADYARLGAVGDA